MRKSTAKHRPASATEARADIKRKYKRGRKTEKVLTGESALDETQRIVKRELFCYLKAQDFSYNYISDSLGISKDTMKKWAQEPEIRERVTEIATDFVEGAIKYARTYAIEMLEMLAEIARTTHDDKTAIMAITEFLDRIGLTKVNKSESKSAQTIREERSVDITDKTGFLDAIDQAPPHVQAQVAAKLEEAFSLASEHTERNMTHA